MNLEARFVSPGPTRTRSGGGRRRGVLGAAVALAVVLGAAGPAGALTSAAGIARRACPQYQAKVAEFERLTGGPLEAVRTYLTMGEPLLTECTRWSASKRRTVAVTVKSTRVTTKTNPDGTVREVRQQIRFADVARGAVDADFDRYAREAKELERLGARVVFTFHHEMDNDVASHGGPADFKAAWARLAQRFATAPGIELVPVFTAWGFTANGSFRAPAYWPTARTDGFGVDGYNWGRPFRDLCAILGPAMDFARSKGKRVHVLEYGSAPGLAGERAEWLRGAHRCFASRNVDVAASFHATEPGDWTLNADELRLLGSLGRAAG